MIGSSPTQNGQGMYEDVFGRLYFAKIVATISSVPPVSLTV